MSNVRLTNKEDSYVIAVDFWNEVLDWAEDNGIRIWKTPTLESDRC